MSEIEFTEYTDGETAPERLARVEEHLRQCDWCAEALAGSRRGAVAVAGMASVAAPRSLQQRVLAKLRPLIQHRLNCRQARPLLQDALDRCLSPLMAIPLQRHLEGCTVCQSQYASLASAARAVRSLSFVAAPASVCEAVRAAQPVAARPAIRGLRPALALAGAAGAAALLLLGRPAQQPVTPNRLAVAPTRAPGRAPTAPQAGEPAVSAARTREVAEAAEPERPAPGAVGPARLSGERPSRRMAAAGRVDSKPKPGPSAFPPVVVAAASTVPSAVQILRTVAKAVAYEDEARRAMALDAERFATLSSEEMLSRFPDMASLGVSETSSGMPERPVTGETAGEGPDSSSSSGRDSASSELRPTFGRLPVASVA